MMFELISNYLVRKHITRKQERCSIDEMFFHVGVLTSPIF